MVIQNKYDTISISKEVARKCGICAAHVFAYLSGWINFNAQKNQNVINGRVWTFGTAQEICSGVEFFSLRSVKTALAKLVEAGFIVKDNFNKKNIDRTSWYSLGNTAIPHKPRALPKVQNLHDAKCKSCTMQSANFAPPIPNKKLNQVNEFTTSPTPPPAKNSTRQNADTTQNKWGGGVIAGKMVIRKWPSKSEFQEWLNHACFHYDAPVRDDCYRNVIATFAQISERGGIDAEGHPVQNWQRYFGKIIRKEIGKWMEYPKVDIEES